MGGEITFSSIEGQGTTFTFSLPMAPLTAVAQKTETQIPSPLNEIIKNDLLQGIRILMAEDNPMIQRILSIRLSAFKGLEVKMVANGIETVEAALQHPYDLIFFDCQMPKMDGYQAALKIRKIESESPLPAGKKRIPIIALTANAFQEDRDKCLAAGMDDYLSKPINFKDLVACIERWTR